MKLATIDTPIGFTLPPHTVTLRRMRYSVQTPQGDWPADKWQNNIHTDVYAQKVGLKGGAAEGEATVEIALLEPLVNFFGEAFFTSGIIDVKLTSPVYVDDTLTGKAKVRQKLATEAGTRFVLDIWVEKDDGSLAVVGTASALVK